MKCLLTLVLLLGSLSAHAQLIMSCAEPVAAGASANTCKTLQYSEASDSLSVVSSANGVWSGSTWNTYAKTPATSKLVHCLVPVIVGLPFKAGVIGADPCPSKAWVQKSTQSPPKAGQVRMEWPAVTKYTDGKTIAPGDHLGYEISWWEGNTFPHVTRRLSTASTTALVTLPTGRICADVVTKTRNGNSSATPALCLNLGQP